MGRAGRAPYSFPWLEPGLNPFIEKTSRLSPFLTNRDSKHAYYRIDDLRPSCSYFAWRLLEHLSNPEF